MYKISTGKFIFRVSDNAFIPIDMANADYQAYLVWAAVPGNVAAAYP